MDLNDFRKRVRRRGLLGALAEGPAPPRPPQAPAVPGPLSAPAPAPPGPLADHDTVEFELDPQIAERLAGCTLSCAALITGLADLPAVEHGGQVIEVALMRLRVRRPEGEADACVRQHVPPEIRGVIEPGSGVMVYAHVSDRAIAVVDWGATGDWIGAKLSFPTEPAQYDWPPAEEWPSAGQIEVYDVDGLRERLHERRGGWTMASGGLMALTPLRSRVDRRDQWRVVLMMRDGRTIELEERLPGLALARLRSGDEPRIGTPIDVLVSSEGEITVDWEATLRQPELRSSRR